ncbi:hypothetical protein [uncultured Anaerococcus sp.]|uniref:hypothetical protein n=1 Tax=uncultured Anaerococcus sp. TaxID=293428 RepID=UPI00288941AE|nr:hypothetical protein [uncultured Anaerococcus sp.]
MKKKNRENKNSETLFKAIGSLEEETYKVGGKSVDLDTKAKHKSFSWKKIGALAACLALVFVSLSFLKEWLPGSTSMGPSKEITTDEAGGFMKYEGPILPLILGAADYKDDIRAERKLTFDFFTTNIADQSPKRALLKDKYIIENKGPAKKIKFFYPFVSSVDDLAYSCPTIDQDGNALQAKLYYGNYAGDFVSTANEIDPAETLNLRDYMSWKDYQKALNEGSYLKDALDKIPNTKDIPVTVYSLTNSYYEENNKDENPTLVSGIEIDREKSKVLSLGFDGFGKFDDGKEEFYQYSIPKKNEKAIYGDKHYLIILGQDTPSVKIEAQSIGGWDGYEEKSSKLRNNLKNAGADLERQEMSLDEALDLTLPLLFEGYKERQSSREKDFAYWKMDNGNIPSYTLSYEEYKALYIRELYATGVLSKKPMMRYENGNLDLMDVTNTQRIIFAEFEIDLGENQTSQITINSYKQGSYDFYGGRNDQKIYGYDLLTKLDSAIDVDKFETQIIDYDKLTIGEGNFGFDLEKNIKTQTLSKDQDHYYMEVRGKK